MTTRTALRITAWSAAGLALFTVRLALGFDTPVAIADQRARSSPLDRQRGVLRPFAHRPVVERQIVESKLVRQEQIDGG